MKFRPCIDLHKGKVKQIVGSTFSDTDDTGIVTNFEAEHSPAHYANKYKKDNLQGGHVIMLGPGNETAAKEALAAYPSGMQVGGGITPENAGEYLDAGASHVIVTSFVFQNGTINWEHCAAIAKAVGKHNLVLDLSCKRKHNRYYIVTDRWQHFTDVTVTQDTLERLAAYCSEFLVHAADVEGKQEGVDIGLITLLSSAAPIPVTYAGGIRSIDDLDMVNTLGKGRIDATVGSALDIFGGTLAYEKVVAWHRKQGK